MGRFVVPGSLSAVGTPKYTAPEIFFSKVYSNKCDVYSVNYTYIVKLGVLFYELIYKEVPINGKTNQDLLVKLR
jgi:serine/threonine-protein kinase ULK/ATG1/calcium-dependent protein kinase